MSYLLNDIHDGILIPFSDTEMASVIALSFFTLASILADLIAIYAIVKQRDIPLDTRFILSLILADLLFSLLCAALETTNGELAAVPVRIASPLSLTILNNPHHLSIIRRLDNWKNR